MRNARNRLSERTGMRWAGLIVVPVLLLTGCSSQKQPVYQGKEGFRFTPPPGWNVRGRMPRPPGRAIGPRIFPYRLSSLPANRRIWCQ